MKRALVSATLCWFCAVSPVIGQESATPPIEIAMAQQCTSGMVYPNPWAGGPDYDVSLTDDGKAVYRGRSGMSEFGSLQYPVSPSDVRQLAAEFDRSGFFDLQPLYGGMADHDCSVTLTLTVNARRHIVRAFSSGNPPEVVGRLGGRVRAVAHIDRFAQRSAIGADRERASVTLGVFANLLERLEWSWPEARLLQDNLKGNQVSTPEAAEGLAWAAFKRRTGGIGTNDVVQISGLYRVGRAIEGFAEPGDLAWEARLWHDAGTSDVIWISARTGAVVSWVPTVVPPAK